MYEFSFDTKEHYFPLSDNLKVSVRIAAESSVFVAARWIIEDAAEVVREVTATNLRNIATDELVEGSFSLRWIKDSKRVQLNLTASLDVPIKSIILLLDGMKYDSVEFVDIRQTEKVSTVGLMPSQIRPINYPRQIKMPIWVLQNGIESHYVICQTDRVESISLGSYFDSRRNSRLTLVANHIRLTNTYYKYNMPAVEIGLNEPLSALASRRIRFMQESCGLMTLSERSDKPNWLDEIDLTVNLHGQHWLGKMLNTYSDWMEFVDQYESFLAERKVLYSLVGWDGPYWKGDYYLRPVKEMGGEPTFNQLIHKIHKSGGKVVVFAPLCAVNATLVKDNDWEEGVLRRPWGAEAWCDWSDWNCDLENEPIVFMNLGYEPFRMFLIKKYSELITSYKVDGIYLDVTNYWENDPKFDHYEGLELFLRSMRESFAELLIFGENWYDFLLTQFPMFAEPGNYMGPDGLLDPFVRSKAYLACPSLDGSGGVHGKARNYLGHRYLSNKTIPYLTIAEDWKESQQNLTNFFSSVYIRRPLIGE